MSRKTIFYLLFFSGLVLVFLTVVSIIIPDFANPKKPVISYVQPFSFTTQDGNPFTQKDVNGKVYVAAYFFTTCKGICPRMNNNMRKVYEKYKDEPDFMVLSHTSDPDRDSAARLKKYADSMQVNTARWVFLTGRKDSLYKQARVSYTIDDPANNLKSIEDDFLHTQFFALVNKNGEVIKIYDSLKESEVKTLISDIHKLLKE